MAKAELSALIDSFVIGPILDAHTDTAADSDEEYWATLPVDGSRHEQLQLVQSRPACDYSRGTVHVVRQNSVNKQVMQRQGRRCLLLTCFSFGCKGEH